MMMGIMKMALFDPINAITKKNASYKYNKKDCNAYMLMMWFSHSDALLPLLDNINDHFFDMGDDIVYKCLYDGVPVGYRQLKYIKGTKNKTAKKQEKIINSMIEDYELSKEEAFKLFTLYIKD